MVVVWLNTIGLGSNILGVLMLFHWGFPQPEFSGGGALIVEDSNLAPDGRTYGSVRREAKATFMTYNNLSGMALFLILVGFVLQIIATWWDVWYPKVS
jgi:hypothetical protein